MGADQDGIDGNLLRAEEDGRPRRLVHLLAVDASAEDVQSSQPLLVNRCMTNAFSLRRLFLHHTANVAIAETSSTRNDCCAGPLYIFLGTAYYAAARISGLGNIVPSVHFVMLTIATSRRTSLSTIDT